MALPLLWLSACVLYPHERKSESFRAESGPATARLESDPYPLGKDALPYCAGTGVDAQILELLDRTAFALSPYF